MPHAPEGWSRSLEFAEAAPRRRARDPPDVRDQPAGRALLARLDVPVRRDAVVPRHAHAARRRRARSGSAIPRSATRCAPRSPTRRVARSCSCGRSCAVEIGRRPEHERYLDRSVTDIAERAGRRSARRVPRPLARRRSRDAVRARGAARRRRARSGDRGDRCAARRDGRQLRRRRAPAVVLRRRLHDPAAHASGRPTCSRSKRRSRGSRRSRQPTYGITDRGTLDAGQGRPTCCSSTASTSPPPTRRATCATSPPTAAATSSTPTGYHSVIVNGEVMLRDGEHTGAHRATCCGSDRARSHRRHETRRHDPGERRRPRRRTARRVRAPPPREVQGHRAADRAPGRRHRRVEVPRLRDPQRRAQRGRRPAARGVRHRPDELRRAAPGLLRRRRARARHERQRRARLAQLPVAARASPGRLFAALDDKDAALALCRAYNDWHIDEWCGAAPDRFIPLAIPPIWDPGRDRRRGAPRRRRRAATRSRSPRTRCRSDCPSLHSDHWDPFWKACSDDGHGRVHAHRLVVEARDHRARRADRRDDHPAADEHRAGRGRPHLLAGVQEVPRRDRSRCPRAGSAGSPTSSSALDHTYTVHKAWTAPTSAASCRARCSWST